MDQKQSDTLTPLVEQAQQWCALDSGNRSVLVVAVINDNNEPTVTLSVKTVEIGSHQHLADAAAAALLAMSGQSPRIPSTSEPSPVSPT